LYPLTGRILGELDAILLEGQKKAKERLKKAKEKALHVLHWGTCHLKI